MKISTAALEEAVLSLLCFSPDHAVTVAYRLEGTALFTNPHHQRIADVALEYVKQYNTAPGGQLDYLLENDLNKGEYGKLLSQSLAIFGKQVTQVQPEFIIEKLDFFNENQRLQKTLQEALELSDQGDLQQAKDRLYKQITLPNKGSPGILLNDPRQALRFMNREEANDYFSSGIPLLDKRGIRPERKTFMFIIAPTGKGKSWWLVECCKAGWQYRHKVLYVTLELSEEKVAQRLLQSIFALTKEEAENIDVARFQKDEWGNATSIDVHRMERAGLREKKKEIFDRLASSNLPKFIVKEFPTGGLSIEHLTLYLDSLKRDQGFEPDLIAIDYADLMKINSESLRIDTGRLYKELRGIGVIRNAAIVSASQGNKESATAKVIDETHAAEDWSKPGTADIVITYNQTIDEYKVGLARIFVAKAREEEGKFMALISQNYRIGQFCIDSVPMQPQLKDVVAQLGA